MEGDLTVASTTDTQEEVNEAAGVAPEENAGAEQPSEQPGEGAQPQGERAGAAQPGEQRPGEAQAHRPKGNLQKRIDKLTGRNYQLERDLEQERAKRTELEAQISGRPGAETRRAPEPEPAASASGKPQPKDFRTVEEYYEALGRWGARQEIEAARDKEQREKTDARVRDVFDRYNRAVADARGRYDDFDEVVGRNVQVPVSAITAIYEMENGPDVAYHLGKHPELIEKLNSLSPVQAAIEVGRISDSLTRPPAPRKPVTAAPAPIKPVGGTSRGSTVPLDELPYQDFKRARAQGRN